MKASSLRIRARTALRVLRLAAPPLAVLVLVLPACFDESTYQGGGRRDIGGELVPVDAGGDDIDAARDDAATPAADAGVDTGTIADTGAAG